MNEWIGVTKDLIPCISKGIYIHSKQRCIIVSRYESNKFVYGGLPLIMYASRGVGVGVGVGGSTLMHTNGYKGGGGSEHDQKIIRILYAG